MTFRCSNCTAIIDPGPVPSPAATKRRLSKYATCECGAVTCFGSRESWSRWYAIAYKVAAGSPFFPLSSAKTFYRRIGDAA